MFSKEARHCIQLARNISVDENYQISKLLYVFVGILVDRFQHQQNYILSVHHFTGYHNLMFDSILYDGFRFNSFQVHNADQLEKWCLHFISTNYAAFSKLPEFSTLTESDRAYIKKNIWPPLSSLQKEETEARTTTETVGRRRHKRHKCSVM